MATQVFNTEFPEAEDLILCAINQRPLEFTGSEWDHQCLQDFIESYLRFVRSNDIYGGSFWVDLADDQRFPLEDFQLSLQMFFTTDSFWESYWINDMKQEHLRVLFWIAALRYRSLLKPVQQLKFGRGTVSKQGILDLFLFDRWTAHPIYGLQIQLLAPRDLDQDGQILPSTRGHPLQNKGLNNFGDYRRFSEKRLKKKLASARTCAVNAAVRGKRIANFNTRGYVVLITPYQVVWLDCGLYSEDLTHPDSQNRAPSNFSGLQGGRRTVQRGQSGSQIFRQNFPSLPLQFQQAQESMIHSNSQHDRFLFSLGSQSRIQSQAKCEPDPDRVSWKTTQFSQIPENDHDSSVGHEASGQNLPNNFQEQGSVNSWRTKWTVYNRRTSNQIQNDQVSENGGFGFPLSQAENFPSNIQPWVVFPDPNLMNFMMSLISNFYGSDQMSNVSTEVSQNGFKPKSNC